MRPFRPYRQRQCCHREEYRRRFAGPTWRSLSLLWRAIRRGGLPSLLLLLFSVSDSHATALTDINIIWRTQPDPSTRSQIEAALTTSHGSTISEARLTRLLETTLARLADYGHHRATLEPQNFSGNDDSLAFDLVIDPGPIALISQWRFADLRRTDSLWLANVLDLPISVAATRETVADAIARISGFSTLSLAGAPEFVSNADESVTIVLRLNEQSPARLEGALAAGSPNGADQSLLGRFSLGLNGLFRRGHSLDVRYEHPQPSERLLHLTYSEHYALWRSLTSSVHFEDWRRDDHRQQVGTNLSLRLWRRQNVDLLLGGSWQKIAPLASATNPSRQYESTAGVKLGDSRSTTISVTGTYSLHRQWDREASLEVSQSRLRLESQGTGAIALGFHSRIRLSYGARWWSQVTQSHPGDEWFLGGEVLSGYSVRSIAASEGVWSRIELSRKSASGLGISIFGDQAWLRLFDESYTRPSTLGLAFLLNSQGRSGRLELAWKDRASLRDGILRLSVIQDW